MTSWDDKRPASFFNIGDSVRYCRGITRARSPLWVNAHVYRKTKNFVYVQTATRKVKFEKDSMLYIHA